jgi:prephenate dehydratase
MTPYTLAYKNIEENTPVDWKWIKRLKSIYPTPQKRHQWARYQFIDYEGVENEDTINEAATILASYLFK